MTKYEELNQQKQVLDAQIKAARAEYVAEAIKEVRFLISEFGISTKKLFKTSVRKTAAKKYRDPASGKEWSGRGITPVWIRSKDRSEFLI